jgi:hypothetical protein
MQVMLLLLLEVARRKRAFSIHGTDAHFFGRNWSTVIPGCWLFDWCRGVGQEIKVPEKYQSWLSGVFIIDVPESSKFHAERKQWTHYL